LTFDTDDDVDLYVLGPPPPADDLVYYGNTTGATGGTLDLDANRLCTSNPGNSENITWPQGEAPEGTYTVSVNLFKTCSNGPINYTVTVTVLGNTPEIYTGSFVAGDADEGATLTPVATFDLVRPTP
jgi:uncharacterized protein YfaP (DUF2135 family)